MPVDNEALFTIENLCFTYPEQETAVLQNLSFSIKAGEFVVLAGPSGCGKSTLLRQLKSALQPHGRRSGRILFHGAPLEQAGLREQSARIGFVQQSPENQVVTDKVWHELAFGLESLGCKNQEIRARVAEIAAFFGIQDWFHKNVAELSGGQKQLMNLAAVMVLRPDVLILDEPASQLDPIAAADFLAAVGKINRELGTTVLMTEHRLEELLPMSDRMLVLEQGRLIADGSPALVGAALREKGDGMFLAMPAAMRVWAAADGTGQAPLTVRDGRNWLEDFFAGHEKKPLPPELAPEGRGPAVLAAEGLWFRYEKEGPDVLRGLSLELRAGELLALLGGNGVGKSTLLSLITGTYRPLRGRIYLEGQPLEQVQAPFSGLLAALPQDPKTLFVEKTVRLDLLETLHDRKLPREAQLEKLAAVTALCRLENLLDRHPYDLSGGEQQRAALAKVLLLEPHILLLDEPTKGLDAAFKREFAAILRGLMQQGVAILMVSHDVEFCARYASRCALVFDGTVTAQERPRPFFSANSFYTTACCRMARQLAPGAVTAEDLIAVCGGESQPEPEPPQSGGSLWQAADQAVRKKEQGLPLWRKILALLGAAMLLLVMGKQLDWYSLPDIWDGWAYGIYLEVLLPALLILLALGRKGKRPLGTGLEKPARQKLKKRTILAAVLILLCIPVTIWAGTYFWGGRKFLFIALLVLLECMLPFFLLFEGRRPQARELVIIAVLCAMGVVGRTALFMLPGFKPVLALVILSGVAFGGETGFLVGAVTMLLSNMLLGQGPWTPWQMFAMGIIGFLSGLLFRKGLLRRDRLSLCIFGFLCALVIYGGIMNPVSALLAGVKLSWPVLLTYYASGLPADLVHGAATVFFLWLGAEPMLEKLDRIKTKYGLIV